MKRFLSLLILLFATNLIAADHPVACSGANCKVIVETRNGSSTKVTAISAAGTGVVTVGPAASAAANLVVNGKITNAKGGMLKSNNATSVAVSGTMVVPNEGSSLLVGNLSVVAFETANATNRTSNTYSVLVRFGVGSITSLASATAGAGSAFTVSVNGSNDIVVTNTSAQTANIYATFTGVEK